MAVAEQAPPGTTLILNLRGIDKVSSSPLPRSDGFVPFKDLGRVERYAEVLGHELAHAAWHLADPERARLGQDLQEELQERMAMVVRAGRRDADGELRRRVEELDRAASAVEAPAEEAEAAVWRELRAWPPPR